MEWDTLENAKLRFRITKTLQMTKSTKVQDRHRILYMYLCAYIRIHVLMCAVMLLCAYLCSYVCIYVLMCVFMFLYMHAYDFMYVCQCV